MWKTTGFYVAGCLLSVGLWSIWLYVPDKAMALLLLGLSPFIIRAIPEKILPRSFGPAQVAAPREQAAGHDRGGRQAGREVQRVHVLVAPFVVAALSASWQRRQCEEARGRRARRQVGVGLARHRLAARAAAKVVARLGSAREVAH